MVEVVVVQVAVSRDVARPHMGTHHGVRQQWWRDKTTVSLSHG